jgi:hypothetical protein
MKFLGIFLILIGIFFGIAGFLYACKNNDHSISGQITIFTSTALFAIFALYGILLIKFSKNTKSGKS